MDPVASQEPAQQTVDDLLSLEPSQSEKPSDTAQSSVTNPLADLQPFAQAEQTDAPAAVLIDTGVADSAADQAVEYADGRNSLFNSDVSSLTRPSDPKNAELRTQFIDMTQSIDLAAGPETAAKADNNMLEAIESQQMQDHFSNDLLALQRRGTVQMDIDTSSLNKGGILGSGAESDRVRGTRGGGLETVNEDIDEPEENAQQKITTLIAKKNVDISEADLQMMVALR